MYTNVLHVLILKLYLVTLPFKTKRVSFPSLRTSPSSRGLGHRPFTAVTRVRIPLGARSTAVNVLQIQMQGFEGDIRATYVYQSLKAR
jgi:hypothetical protein